MPQYHMPRQPSLPSLTTPQAEPTKNLKTKFTAHANLREPVETRGGRQRMCIMLNRLLIATFRKPRHTENRKPIKWKCLAKSRNINEILREIIRREES